ncbi:MAG: hypothetical protein B9S32_06695 [Verrucomicrobia bacterium Tous-C9LFEB]|nr:MAG: hypothetical protein B9S32_06695 [Verrucomicrobia bacterium Tous-C9LFEB]
MKHAIATLSALSLILMGLAVTSSPLHGATVIQDAVEWWAFEGNNTGAKGINLSPVASTTAGLTPTVTPTFTTATGISAADAGTSAIRLDGTTALKSNSTSLRIGTAQTFWLRVNFSSVSGTMALMDRSRAVNGQRGISLQMTDGHLAGYASSDGTTYEAQLYSTSSYTLLANTWYDVALRYDPSNELRIDLYDPTTGLLLQSRVLTTNVPAQISTASGIGSGYFQIGSLNNGSSGSAFVMPDGSMIEAAGVWNRYLSDAELASLSAAPEPATLSMLLFSGTLGTLLFRKKSR